MRYLKRVAVLAVTCIALLAATAGTASAAPSPGYGEWTDCPSRSVDPNIVVCFLSIVDSGHLQMGNTDTPIVDPIRLVGSLSPEGGDGGTFYVGSFDGGTQPVPGGIIGITELDWLINLFPGNLLALYASAELAGTPSSPLQEPFHLPLKVKLTNPLLSSNCYIGSNTNPINLNLVTSTTNPPPPNEPISGEAGHPEPDPVLPGVVRVHGTVLVDNEFAAPAAQGCGFLGLGLIDSLVNSIAGLPSPAGTNETVQPAEVSLASVFAVYQPDGID